MARPLDTGAWAAAADVSNAARAAETSDGAGAVAGAGAGADASNLDLRSLSFDILRGGQVANRERPVYMGIVFMPAFAGLHSALTAGAQAFFADSPRNIVNREPYHTTKI